MTDLGHHKTSAWHWKSMLSLSMIANSDSIKRLKSSGPSLEPCSTPHGTDGKFCTETNKSSSATEPKPKYNRACELYQPDSLLHTDRQKWICLIVGCYRLLQPSHARAEDWPDGSWGVGEGQSPCSRPADGSVSRHMDPGGVTLVHLPLHWHPPHWGEEEWGFVAGTCWIYCDAGEYF